MSLEEYFDRFSGKYDDQVLDTQFDFSAPREVCEAMPLVRGGLRRVFTKNTTLDIGCGTGLLGVEESKKLRPNNMTGVDFSSDMLAEARDKKIYGERLHQLDIERKPLPFHDGSFQQVGSSGVFEFIEDMSLPIVEIGRVLETGGGVCFTTFSHFGEGVRGFVELEVSKGRIPKHHVHSVDYVLTEFFNAGMQVRHLKTFPAYCVDSREQGYAHYNLFSGRKL